MADIEKHKRVHDMILGPLERPTLRWMAARMPGWVTPDQLTIFGTFGALLILVSYLLTNINTAFFWLASFGFIINWIGDSLDGTLARFRKIERPRYGFFIDHIVDSFNMVLIALGLGLSVYIRLDVAAVALVGYLLMSILAYVNAFVSGEFKISYARLGPTEVRVLIIILNTVMFLLGVGVIQTSIGEFSYYDLLLSLIALILFVFFIVNSINEGKKWNRLDPGIKQKKKMQSE
jgi:phosphatidylglycerophosphate synthase